MIITISGYPGSGKSSAARLLAKKLGYSYHSIGELMRNLAKERGVSLLEISKEAEQDRKVDDALDRAQIALGESQDNFVLDSRLGYHFVPRSFKVFLKVDIKEAARRIYGANREHEHENVTFEETVHNVNKRIESEKKRYEEYYNLNPYDEANYDLIVDTTGSTVEKNVQKIVDALK